MRTARRGGLAEGVIHHTISYRVAFVMAGYAFANPPYELIYELIGLELLEKGTPALTPKTLAPHDFECRA
jgi:hypothetical protein